MEWQNKINHVSSPTYFASSQLFNYLGGGRRDLLLSAQMHAVDTKTVYYSSIAFLSCMFHFPNHSFAECYHGNLVQEPTQTPESLKGVDSQSSKVEGSCTPVLFI